MPVAKQAGDEVIGATMNGSGSFVMRATRVGRDTALGRIVELVRRAQGSKAPIQRTADRVSEWFVPFVLVVAALTFVVWLLVGPEPRLPYALVELISVVVIACPCAMGLATPTAIMVGTGRGAESGILIRGGEALEAAQGVRVVAFDKTGTLTEGRPEVVAIHAIERGTEAQILGLAAAAERGSEHPLGEAIVRRAEAGNVPIGDATSFESLPGRGVVAGVIDASRESRTVLVGTARLLHERGIATPELDAGGGATPAYVAIDGTFAGRLDLADPVKPAARATVEALERRGIEAWLVTGDSAAVAAAVAEEVGIRRDRVRAEVLPGDKAAVVRELQASRGRVAMVGDGVNDAPALATADVGIAIGSGAEVAIEAAAITLVGDDPSGVAAAVELSRATMRTIRENLVWAFGYNVVLIPVAMGVLYPAFGILVNPAFAAAAMALSSVSVVLNSLRLRGFRFARPALAPTP
jgi:Cu+-exporting ATPase